MAGAYDDRDGVIWLDGKLVPWREANVHVLTHALHYGSSVFEGIRVYETPNGSAVFRLTDHLKRMYDSARIYHMPIPYEFAELHQSCTGIVTRNER